MNRTTSPSEFFALPKAPASRRSQGFTLLEILIASVSATVILAAVYGLFSSAVRMRDAAAENTRVIRLRAHALSVIRNDLRNGLVSGGVFASALEGDSNGSGSDASFPGYLKLTTTTGKDNIDAVYGDIQQVEYYVSRDPNDPSKTGSGVLIRAVTRDLLNNSPSSQGSLLGGASLTGTSPGSLQEEQILAGVKSMEVSFYDGTTWQSSWITSGSDVDSAATAAGSAATSGSTSTTGTAAAASTSGSTAPQILPYAVRIDIHMATPEGKTEEPPPLEILVPWSNAPFLSGTNFIIGSDSINSDTTTGGTQ